MGCRARVVARGAISVSRCVLEAGTLRPNPALPQPAATSSSGGRGSAVPRGLAGVRSVWQPKAPSLRARPGGISCATLPGDKRWPRGRYPTGPAPGGSGCPPRGAVGLVQLAMHVACEQRWLRGTVSVRPQQEGGMNGFSENLHHLMTGYSFIYMIFLLTVTNNCYTSQTPRAINNFSPGAIFLKRWHIRSLYVGPCSKSPF